MVVFFIKQCAFSSIVSVHPNGPQFSKHMMSELSSLTIIVMIGGHGFWMVMTQVGQRNDSDMRKGTQIFKPGRVMYAP